MSETSLAGKDGQDGQFFAPDGRKFVYQNPMVRRGYANSSDRKKSPSPISMNNVRSVIPRSFKPPKKGEKHVTEAVNEQPILRPTKQQQQPKQQESKAITSAIEYITNPVKLIGSMFSRSDKKTDKNKAKRQPVTVPPKSAKPNPPKRELPKPEEPKVEEVDPGVLAPTIIHSMGDFAEVPKKKYRPVANVYKENDNWKMVNSRKPKPKVVQPRRPRSQSPIAMIRKEAGTSVELINQVELNAGMFMKKEKPNTASFRIQSAEGMARESKMLEKEKRKSSKHSITSNSRRKNPYTYAPKDVERPKHSWQRPKDLPKPKALKMTKNDFRPESRELTNIAEIDPSLDKSNSNHCTASPIPGDFSTPSKPVEENVCFSTEECAFPAPDIAMYINQGSSQTKDENVVQEANPQGKKPASEVRFTEDSINKKENENTEGRSRSRSRSRTRRKPWDAEHDGNPTGSGEENVDKEVNYRSRRTDLEEDVTRHNINNGSNPAEPLGVEPCVTYSNRKDHRNELEISETITESYGLIDNLFKLFSPMVMQSPIDDQPLDDPPVSQNAHSKTGKNASSGGGDKPKTTRKEKNVPLRNKKTDDITKQKVTEEKKSEAATSSYIKTNKKEPSPSPFNPQRLFKHNSASETRKSNEDALTVTAKENNSTEAANYTAKKYQHQEKNKSPMDSADAVISPSRDGVKTKSKSGVTSPSKDGIKGQLNEKVIDETKTQKRENLKTSSNTKLKSASNISGREEIKTPSHTKLDRGNKSPKQEVIKSPSMTKENNETKTSKSSSNTKINSTSPSKDKEIKSPNNEQLKNKKSSIKTKSRAKSPSNKNEKNKINTKVDSVSKSPNKELISLLDLENSSPFKTERTISTENKDSDTNKHSLKSAAVLKEIEKSELDLFEEVVKSPSPFKSNNEILKQEKELNMEIYKDFSPCIDTMTDNIDTLMETNKQLLTSIDEAPLKIGEFEDFLPEISLSHDTSISNKPMPPPCITEDDHLIRIPLFGKQQAKVTTKRDTKAKANMLAPRTAEHSLGNKWAASHKPTLLDNSNPTKTMTKQQILAFGTSIAIPKPIDSPHVSPTVPNKSMPSVIGAAKHRFYFSKCSGNSTNSVILPSQKSPEVDQVQTFLLDTVSHPTFPPSVLTLNDSRNDSPLGVAIPMNNCQASPINKTLPLNNSAESHNKNAVHVCNHVSATSFPLEITNQTNASEADNEFLVDNVISSISGLLPIVDKEVKKHKKAHSSKNKTATEAHKKQRGPGKVIPKDANVCKEGVPPSNSAQQKTNDNMQEQQKSQARESSENGAVIQVAANRTTHRPPPRIKSPIISPKRPTSPVDQQAPSSSAPVSSLYEILKNLCLAENSSERGEVP